MMEEDQFYFAFFLTLFMSLPFLLYFAGKKYLVFSKLFSLLRLSIKNISLVYVPFAAWLFLFIEGLRMTSFPYYELKYYVAEALTSDFDILKEFYNWPILAVPLWGTVLLISLCLPNMHQKEKFLWIAISVFQVLFYVYMLTDGELLVLYGAFSASYLVLVFLWLRQYGERHYSAESVLAKDINVSPEKETKKIHLHESQKKPKKERSLRIDPRLSNAVINWIFSVVGSIIAGLVVAYIMSK